MATIFRPPSILDKQRLQTGPSLGLFGSIEMDTAVKWQDFCEKRLEPHDIDIYNPRRNDWNSTWKQDIENAEFKGQVTWELTVLENTNVKLFYFDPSTKSPVTLMELGLAKIDSDVVVCCPPGFWRKGNVDIVCERYGIRQEPTLEDALFDCVSRLRMYHNLIGGPYKYEDDRSVEPAIEEL